MARSPERRVFACDSRICVLRSLVQAPSRTFPHVCGLDSDGGLQFATSESKRPLPGEGVFEAQREERTRPPWTPLRLASLPGTTPCTPRLVSS